MGFEQLADLKALLAAKAREQGQQRKTPSPKTGAAAEAKVADPAQETRRGKSRASRPPKAPATTRSPKNDVDPTVVLLGRLQKQFPLAFPKKPARKVPLKVGMLEDLLLQKDSLRMSEEEVRAALSMWCRGIRYWDAVVEGAARLALDGSAAGHVTEAEAAGARHLRNRRQKSPTENAG